MTEDEFLTLTLPERIAWLHGKDGPQGKLSHDDFAKRLGTSRQTVIGWEKGAQPSLQYRKELSQFANGRFAPQAFTRKEQEKRATTRLVQVEERLRLIELMVSKLLTKEQLEEVRADVLYAADRLGRPPSLSGRQLFGAQQQ